MLTSTQQHLARRMFALHYVAWATTHPDGAISHAKAGQMGASHVDLGDGREPGWGSTQAWGIGWTEGTGSLSPKQADCGASVTWTELRHHLLEVVGPTLAAELIAWWKRSQEISTDPRTNHPGTWSGIPFRVPRNSEGMTHDEVATWWQAEHLPAVHGSWAEQDRLADRVWPATGADPEPVDLLDLLAADGG